MKKYNVEATDENVLESIRNNTYNRHNDIKEFVETLDKIEGNTFISLDARWGEGKTFYVRQIEKTLEYNVQKNWGKPEKVEDLKPYFENTCLEDIGLKQSYLPIYYNAWLYDNHNDPLLSLLFIIVKKCKKYFDTKISKESLLKNISKLIPSITMEIKKVPVAVDTSKVGEVLNRRDIFDEILTEEEIREKVKAIFNDAIVETAQKLVVFVDELDRCRPSFAIEMLERIKHYFDDDRIIFIVSVNKERLIHTISKYYGMGFDSTGYLNKFFDYNVHMPEIKKDTLFESYNSEQRSLISIADGLSEYYKLTLRDSFIFKSYLSGIPEGYVHDFTTQGCCLSIFVPIIAVLDIVDVQEKVKFLNGKSDILEVLSQNIPALHMVISNFGARNKEREERYKEGYDKIKEVYNYAFGKMIECPKFKLDVSANIKEICIRICNRFGR